MRRRSTDFSGQTLVKSTVVNDQSARSICLSNLIKANINNNRDITIIIAMPITTQPHVTRNSTECQEFQNSFYLQHLRNPSWTPAYPGYYNDIQVRFWQYGHDHEWVPPFFTGVKTSLGCYLPYSEPLYLFPSHFLYED